MNDTITLVWATIMLAAQLATLLILYKRKKSRAGRVYSRKTGLPTIPKKTEGRVYRRPASKNIQLAPGDEIVNP